MVFASSIRPFTRSRSAARRLNERGAISSAPEKFGTGLHIRPDKTFWASPFFKSSRMSSSTRTDSSTRPVRSRASPYFCLSEGVSFFFGNVSFRFSKARTTSSLASFCAYWRTIVSAYSRDSALKLSSKRDADGPSVKTVSHPLSRYSISSRNTFQGSLFSIPGSTDWYPLSRIS